MPIVIVTNPMRALQVENQRLHRENLALRREVEALRQQLADGGENREHRARNAPTQPAPAIGSVQAPAPMSLVRSAPLEAPTTRPAFRPLASGPAPRQVIHLVATDATGASAPRATRPEPDALDDAATRFMLLELD